MQASEFGLKRLQLLVDLDLAVELLLAVKPGGELVDLAAEAQVGLAAGDVAGERLPLPGGERQQGGKECGVEAAR